MKTSSFALRVMRRVSHKINFFLFLIIFWKKINYQLFVVAHYLECSHLKSFRRKIREFFSLRFIVSSKIIGIDGVKCDENKFKLIHLSNSIIKFLVTLNSHSTISLGYISVCVGWNWNESFVLNVLSMTSEEIIQIEIRNVFINDGKFWYWMKFQ